LFETKLQMDIRKIFGFISSLAFRHNDYKVHSPKLYRDGAWIDYLSDNFNKKGKRILEIGSRNVTGANFRGKFNKAEYIGFDFQEGENVDIVGDVHCLSDYFLDTEKFDLIYSSAVFEHLHMPWVAAEQIQKRLKVNGYAFVETHFSFSSHERPWHFFQFSDFGLRALFNEGLGFDLIDSGMSNPMTGFFSHKANKKLRYKKVKELYCHSSILCKKREEVVFFDWNKVHIDKIVEGKRYPIPKDKKKKRKFKDV